MTYELLSTLVFMLRLERLERIMRPGKADLNAKEGANMMRKMVN
jgi:hypothetical protein